MHVELQNAAETIRKLEDKLKLMKEEIEHESRRKIEQRSAAKDVDYWKEKAKYWKKKDDKRNAENSERKDEKKERYENELELKKWKEKK